jgi:hypothetical protein
MAMNNISAAKVATCLAPVVKAATTSGTGVAVGGYSDVTMIWMQGICADVLSGSLYWTITFEESDTSGSGYTLIAAGDIDSATATVLIDAAAEDPTLIVRRYKGSKAYVRMTATATGSHSSGTPIAAVVHLGGYIHAPVTKETELGTAS